MAISLNQNGLTAGSTDKSRSDGLSNGALISITSSVASTLTLVWRPDEETANLTTHDTTHWSISPTAGVYGSYMFYDSATNTKRIFSIRSPNKGLRIPALNETGHSDASLVNSTSPFIDASDFNEISGSGPFVAGNYGGWYSAIRELVHVVENISTSSGGGSGDNGASYLVLSATGSLTNERIFTAGTGINVTDGGAGSTYTVGINNNVIATVSGTTFTGPVISTQITGSLTRTAAGLSAFVAGDGVSVVSNSAGQVLISNTAAADLAASFLTLGLTSSLSNERLFTPSTGLLAVDGGANSNYTLSINNNIVATVSGTNFTGPVTASAGFRATQITGSLTQTAAGLSAYVASTGISVISNSVGQILISNTLPSDNAASYLTLAATASLANERVFTPGVGLSAIDGGANEVYTLNINNGVVATVSGTLFTGNIQATTASFTQLTASRAAITQLTGSHTQTTTGLSAFVGSTGISVVSNSVGQVVITNTGAPAWTMPAIASSNMTASVSTIQRVNVGANAVVISLPDTHVAVDQIIVKLVSTASFVCTVSGSGGDLIDNEASITLTTNYEWAKFISDGTNWLLFS